jgi:hypothetical protein
LPCIQYILVNALTRTKCIIFLTNVTVRIFAKTLVVCLKALGLVGKALYRKHHHYLSHTQIIFLPCLVLTHSENIHNQVRPTIHQLISYRE